MKNKRKSTKRQDNEVTLGSCVKLSALSSLCCSLASFVALALLAAIALCFEDPLMAARYGACAILFLSAFFCGIVSRGLCRSYTLICGILSGTFLFVLTLALYFAYPKGDNTAYGILMRLALLPMSVLGSLAASYKRQRKHRKKH